MPGAPVLSANASIKMGAGIVYLSSIRFHPAIVPEIIQIPIKSREGHINSQHYDEIIPFISTSDAIVIGPGMGKDLETLLFIRRVVLENLSKKWIIDADAIGAFNLNDELSNNITLTPHTGEFLRFFNNTNENTTDWFTLLTQATEHLKCNILLKGPTTIITDGTTFYLNNFGNPGMATAGTGDVLTGIIAANVAKNTKYNPQELSLLQVVAYSSLIHSLSADNYVYNSGDVNINMETLTATDIINNIKNIQFS